jgi:hypothetical protein
MWTSYTSRSPQRSSDQIWIADVFAAMFQVSCPDRGLHPASIFRTEYPDTMTSAIQIWSLER